MTQRRTAYGVVLACVLGLTLSARAQESAAELLPSLQSEFSQEVDRRLDVPVVDQQRMAQRLRHALAAADLDGLSAQYVLMVDRSPLVQALFVFLILPTGDWGWIGAAPVSTGKVGSFDHFRTPLGAFAHTLDNPDFRSEGTPNENHVRGYGERGMRVFDFGWVMAERGWGARRWSLIRLQMHATDPDLLESRLGRPDSKGCIRIPASLNVYLDRHGLLDADYEQALARGEPLWVMRADRKPQRWPGRYLVLIDSGATLRPTWASIGKR